MRTANITKKAIESTRRKRQKEITEMKSIREAKKKLGEAITNKNYHETGHLRHGKF